MSAALIKKLQSYSPDDLTRLYNSVFNTPDGELVFEDMKGRFHEYVPVNNKFQAGQQSVLIHIKNQMNPIDISNEAEKEE